MATLASIRTDVRDRLDESTAAYWSDTEIDRWINEAARDVARRSETLLATTTIAAVTDQQEYALPSDTLRIHRVEWQPSSGQIYPLEYRDFHSMDAVWWTQQDTQTGYPGWYTMWGYPPSLNMIVYPTPDSAGNFKVFYYQLPTAAVADGDTVGVPQGWEDMIALYCEFTALRKDADPRWQEAKALYEERLDDMMMTTRRWSDQADSVQPVSVPHWLAQEDY